MSSPGTGAEEKTGGPVPAWEALILKGLAGKREPEKELAKEWPDGRSNEEGVVSSDKVEEQEGREASPWTP